MQTRKIFLLSSALVFVTGCATTETSRTIETQQVTAAQQSYSGPQTAISIGKFDNRSSYLRGIFTEGEDRLGSQAKTILTTHLQQSKRFSVLDRSNMTEAKAEAKIANTTQQLKGAEYIVTGDVTEFGRKQVGDRQLFGILGRGKTQIAYAKVNLNIVNVTTSEVVHSIQGAGEYTLSNREIVGFGSTASYDSTLNGKVLELAIRDAINKLTATIDNGSWQPQK